MSADKQVDLQEVERLVTALEQDLAKVRTGSQDVQSLRDEVEALRALLNDQESAREPVNARLRSIQALMDTLVDDMIEGARYVREIGRILGL